MDGREETKFGRALEVPGEVGETMLLSRPHSLEPGLPPLPLQSPAERGFSWGTHHPHPKTNRTPRKGIEVSRA